MTQARPTWNWTGVAPLAFEGRDVRLRGLVAKQLPVTKSSQDEIVAYLVDLGARLERWLHQDEFGPTRRQRAAAVNALIRAIQTLQAHFANSPSSLKTQFDAILRDGNNLSNTVLEALFEAAVDLEHSLKGVHALKFHLAWASRLRDCVESLMTLSQVVDTNTDSEIFQTAAVRNFEVLSRIGTDFKFADAERWLNDYRCVLWNTLQTLNACRGPDERVSIKLVVEQLCELWERETESRVTAHGIEDGAYTSRPVTAAGRFVVAAAEAILPDTPWFDGHPAQSVCAMTFRPGYKAHRERHILEIMRDFVRRRKMPKN
jgi:hypothetical protein